MPSAMLQKREVSEAPFTPQKKWVRTQRKVGTDQIFLPRKLFVPCFHETDPDSIFSGFLAIGRTMAPKPKKKTSPDLFCCSKTLFKRIFVPYNVLHVSLPCFTVVSRMCTIALLNHEPSLIVTSVNG